MSSNYSELERSLTAQNKNSQKKFLTVLIRDYLEIFSTKESEVEQMKGKIFTTTNKRKKDQLSVESVLSDEEQSEITQKMEADESETMIEKVTKLKDILQKKKLQVITNGKVEKTVFNKPNKRRK
jgi:hypothetical protein